MNYDADEIEYVSRHGKQVIRTGSKAYLYNDFPITDEANRHYRKILTSGDSLITLYIPDRKGDNFKFKYCFGNNCDSTLLDLQQYGYTMSTFPSTTMQSPVYYDLKYYFTIGEANPFAKADIKRQVLYYDIMNSQLDSLDIQTKQFGFPKSLSLTEQNPYLCNIGSRLFIAQPYEEVVYEFDISQNPPALKDSFLLYDPEKDVLVLETPRHRFEMYDDSVELYLGMIADTINRKIIRLSLVNLSYNGKMVKMHRASIFDLDTRKVSHMNLGTDWLRFYIYYFKNGQFALQNLDASEANPGKLIFNVYTYPESTWLSSVSDSPA